MRADHQRHLRNLRVTSELKTLVKQFHASVATRQHPQAQDALRMLTKKIDMAAQKGIIHHNTAARKKARFSRRLTQLAPLDPTPKLAS